MLHGVPPAMFPGGPIMYGPPGAMPPQRGFYMPQGMMGPRPRWSQQGPPPQGPPAGPYGHGLPPPPQHQAFNPGQVHIPPGARPPRPARSAAAHPGRAGAPGGRYPGPQHQKPLGKKVGDRRVGSAPNPTQVDMNAAKENVPNANGTTPTESQPPISREELSKLSPNDQKQALGEAIYMRIQPLAKEHTGKVTGMLLEMENQQLLSLLGDMKSLEAKVKDAVEALKVHMGKVAENPAVPVAQAPQVAPPTTAAAE